MSSREIAAVTKLRHDNVKRTMETLQQKALITFTQSEEKGNGRPAVVYQVNKRDSYVCVAQLSPEFTAVLVDRWQELEQSEAPALPSNYLEALEHLVEKEKLLLEQAPKVAFVKNLVERDNLLTATQVASKHKMSAVKMNKLLAELNVYNKSVKRVKVFNTWFVENGYGEMKKTQLGYDQAMFTNAGELWIYEQFISEGII